jgi:hypothetical protein
MITVTRTSGPDADFSLFTLDRDGEASIGLTRYEAIARLTFLEVEDAAKLVDDAILYGCIVIHEHG